LVTLAVNAKPAPARLALAVLVRCAGPAQREPAVDPQCEELSRGHVHAVIERMCPVRAETFALSAAS
jgi:hypothetical protein